MMQVIKLQICACLDTSTSLATYHVVHLFYITLLSRLQNKNFKNIHILIVMRYCKIASTFEESRVEI